MFVRAYLRRVFLAQLLALLVLSPIALGETEHDEFRVKRQEIFEFAEQPQISKSDNQIKISFTTAGFCDCSVAVENENGHIVRHLASGVLGENAPKPFEKNSKQQVLMWDGKDDQGRYVDTLSKYKVRVSLGLKPMYERDLFWSPHKRFAKIAPILQATKEGVYCFEGQGIDSLKLFDHSGEYLRTIYPFPADKINQVKQLQRHKFPQDGKELPLKLGFTQASLLSSGSSGQPADTGGHFGGFAASAMAVHEGKIALLSHRLNRLATDGSSGGLPIKGPDTHFGVTVKQNKRLVTPTSAAFSPDGKYLYLTGFVWKSGFWATDSDCFHVVMRMEYASDNPPEVFLGEVKRGGYGKDNDHFCVPVSVATDSKGRVYVADFANSRVQIFSAEGKYLKTLKVPFPAQVHVNPLSQEITVFSYPAIGPSRDVLNGFKIDLRKLQTTISQLGTFEKPASSKPQNLPTGFGTGAGGWEETGGQVYSFAVDPWSKPKPTLWSVGRSPIISVAEMNWSGGGARLLGGWDKKGIKIFAQEKNEWKEIRDFAQDTKQAVKRIAPPDFSRQRLYVNPVNHKLYVCEDMTTFGKSFYQLIEIDPETGKIEFIDLPFDTEDICFGIDGVAYLRTDRLVLRYDFRTWREIPWDYGEEHVNIRFISSAGGPATSAKGALPIPGRRPVWWHNGGMWANANGDLAVVCVVREKEKERDPKAKFESRGVGKPYTVKEYPGRFGRWTVMIFDKHGELIHEDAVPGLPGADGIGIDKQNNIYTMVSSPRILKGDKYFDGKSETLMKFSPNAAKIVSTSKRAPVLLPKSLQPEGSPDIYRYALGQAWAVGAQWCYGGVGYGGQGGSCTCWHSRFQLDYFARSFVPETSRYQVAVLDSAGNLILRVGQYGNVDSKGPDSLVPLGGDEVGLMHPAYVGVDTDRRLFIHDGGNQRIVSVKLNYHTDHVTSLKDFQLQEKN